MHKPRKSFTSWRFGVGKDKRHEIQISVSIRNVLKPDHAQPPTHYLWPLLPCHRRVEWVPRAFEAENIYYLAGPCTSLPGNSWSRGSEKKTKLHHMISGLFPQVPGCLRVWWPLLTASFFALVCKTSPLTTSAGFLNRKFPWWAPTDLGGHGKLAEE